ncbi:DUF1120 domain-containing protein [Pseudomonas sp. LB1P83]
MNKSLSLLTAALLLTGASSASAASSTDLTVTGIITPAACTPVLSNNGAVDFGKTSAKDLNQTSVTHLGTEKLQVNVGCDAATTFALTLLDNRSSSTHKPYQYGLGKTSANENLGGFTVTYLDAITDSGPKKVIVSFDEGKTWRNNHHIPVDPDSWAAAGDISTGGWYPVVTGNLAMNVEVDAYIVRADSLTLTDEVTLDGSATLQIKYL